MVRIVLKYYLPKVQIYGESCIFFWKPTDEISQKLSFEK